MTSIALITAIESNSRNLNSQTKTVDIERMFEDEAITCFTNWRKHGGWLKDIPIYALCPTHNIISQRTKQALLDLGVIYEEEYHPITETFTSGFINIPYVGMVYEQRLKEDILIKIDLDMNLLQPLPETLVLDHQVVCGQYDDYCTQQQRTIGDGWANPFDTGFVISRRETNFYQLFFTHVHDIMSGKVIDKNWEVVRSQTGEYYLEEYVVDMIYRQNLAAITPIQRYQLGECYTPVAEFSDADLMTTYFWHEHLIPEPGYDKVRQRVEYFNRMVKIKRNCK